MLNENVLKLIKEVAKENNTIDRKIMEDVIQEEGRLHSTAFLSHNKIELSTSYFYSAIGRVRERYRTKDFENEFVKNIYRNFYDNIK